MKKDRPLTNTRLSQCERLIITCPTIVPASLLFRTKELLKLVATSFALILVAACGSGSEKGDLSSRGAQAKTVEIIPFKVDFRPETIEVQAVGTARAEKTAVISADDGGEVTDVYFEAGDKVSEGDVLLTLELDEERLAVDRARVAVKDAEQLIARFEGIEIPGAISDSRIDDVKIAAERARIELRLAKIALAKRQVRAPFSGIVGLTNIDAGARITSDTEITRLDDRSILFVDFQAPEEVYGVIEVGAAIDIAPFADAGTIYQAKVRKIDSRIDQASRSFTVRAEIDNAADRLRPGMSFKIDFQLPGRAYPVVPEAAIIWGGDGAYIWLVENGVAKRQSVTIVGRQDGQVLVRAPINEGSIVIAEGVQKVREGTAVEISRLYADPAKNSRAGSASTPTVEIPAALPVTEPVADRP